MHTRDAETTLQSLADVLPHHPEAERLRLTVIFHPDPARIGQSAEVPEEGRRGPWVLGRCNPAFGGGGEAAPLEDPYVSRRALTFSYRRGTLTLARIASSSRARLGAEELLQPVRLEAGQLRRGVTIALSHSIVLMLRLAPDPVQGGAAPGALLGSGPRMQALREQIARVAPGDLDVLIRGETGSGKELVARAIHAASARSAGPLVCVNMAAIPAELAPAALFGSERGAFTGAQKSMPGYFRQARGGSLFLDEIGDTPGAVQPQLLRALQEREIQPVGGRVESADVRILSATELPLEDADGGFRAALRHRLGACEILVPALREHPEDIGELLLHFLREACRETGRESLLPGPQLAPAAVAAWAQIFYLFSRYPWPGNVRELGNFARQVVLASDDRPTLPRTLWRQLSRPGALPSGGRAPSRRIREIDESEFEGAMRAHRFEIKSVAAALEVSRAAVYRRVERSSRFRLAAQVSDAEVRAALAASGGDPDAAAAALEVSAAGLRARLRRAEGGG